MSETSPRHRSLSWIALHTIAIVTVLIQLATGARFATFQYDVLVRLDAILPTGELHSWHLWSGLILSGVALAASIGWLTKGPRSLRRDVPWDRWVIRLGNLCLVALIVTGWVLVLDRGSTLPVDTLHGLAAAGMVVYLLAHGGVYFVQYGWPAIRRIVWVQIPQNGRQALPHLALLSFVSVLVAVIGLAGLRQPGRTLPVPAIDLRTLINVDGVADEPVWRDAPIVHIDARGGANFDAGRTTISVQAVHNGAEAFFHVRWRDPTRSIQHLPLRKTIEGWRVEGDGFSMFDETEYYEDKLAILLSTQCTLGASGTAHMGAQPLKNRPPSWHGRGYHYAEDEHIRDLWHWKAVRTNEMFLADDNYIGRPDIPRPEIRRYTAGYGKDSKESGAYVMNWSWYRPTTIVPKRLPGPDEPLAAYQAPIAFSSETDLPWVGSWFDYRRYTWETDTLPIGTVIPSVLYRSNRFEGDRADVRAHGRWSDGYWTLELVRKLHTDSAFDVPLTDGVCMWVAAFDHAQTRHSRHQIPLRLRLEPSP